MSAYLIFDVEIFDMPRYPEFMQGVKPALEAAGAKYLARAGALKVYEGDWEPWRIVILEFPSRWPRGRTFIPARCTKGSRPCAMLAAQPDSCRYKVRRGW